MMSTINTSACTTEPSLQKSELVEKEEKEHYDDVAEAEAEADDSEKADNEEMRRQMGELPTLAFLPQHRRQLLRLLDKLLSFHQWVDAARVISLLLQSSPTGTLTEIQLRRLFMAMCEIEKRLGDAADFHDEVKRRLGEYIEQMISPSMNATAKLELANFYFSQGEYQEAYGEVKKAQMAWSHENLAQDTHGKGNPFMNLTLGMICYKLWYKNAIPEDMKIQRSDVIGSAWEERGIFDSDLEAGFEGPSVFLARGLDTRLLPIKLRPMYEDIEICIQKYRQLADNNVYEEGVQCLRNALHSSPPKSASLDALEPLIQLLLLGDRVTDAGAELVKACFQFDYSAIPFGLRARFVECFAPKEVDTISSCYQAALKIDATCSSYVEGLIKIHGNRNTSNEHSIMVLLEMIPRHIDAMVPSGDLVGLVGRDCVGREVKTIVWEELASCFLTVSNYFQGRIMSEILSERIVRATWKTRFRWWKEKHFRETSLFSQATISEQACIAGSSNTESTLPLLPGDDELLARKAACACHLYGPSDEYVVEALNLLNIRGNNDDISFLEMHMQSALNFCGSVGSH
ncbi:TAF RNA polymerase I subunit A [Rhynchospora pubera]|uniref:TAF RNA polymerase I subunit A n=1 Tax=Rhynchospora pubera TaxID=906938 RepID=A0AAV8G524_9POAL|nr:TAF RNA polymerase I subunit A [Rhynchospora pubera]